MLELCKVFIRAVNDDVSDNNKAVHNLHTYGRLIINVELCQDSAVAHTTIRVRNSLGFTGWGGTVGMTGIRSRLDLESSLMRIKRVTAVENRSMRTKWMTHPQTASYWVTSQRIFSLQKTSHAHVIMCWLNFSYGSRAMWGVHEVSEEALAAFPAFTDDGRHIINPVTTNLSNK